MILISSKDEQKSIIKINELMILISSKDEQKSIMKEDVCNSSSWSKITLDDITDYKLQRTICDPRSFHDLKKFSMDIAVSVKLDFMCDTRWTLIKITVIVKIESQSVIQKRKFNIFIDLNYIDQ